MSSFGSFDVDVVQKGSVIGAIYKCPDKACNKLHRIMTIDEDFFDVPGNKEIFYKALDEIVHAFLVSKGVEPEGVVVVEIDQPTKGE
jgi:hypothetical protein